MKTIDPALQSLNFLPWKQWKAILLKDGFFVLDIMTNNRDQQFLMQFRYFFISKCEIFHNQCFKYLNINDLVNYFFVHNRSNIFVILRSFLSFFDRAYMIKGKKSRENQLSYNSATVKNKENFYES